MHSTLALSLSAIVSLSTLAHGAPTHELHTRSTPGTKHGMLIDIAHCNTRFLTLLYVAIVQLFQWNWDSIADECTKFIGPAGYGYVQGQPAYLIDISDSF